MHFISGFSPARQTTSTTTTTTTLNNNNNNMEGFFKFLRK